MTHSLLILGNPLTQGYKNDPIPNFGLYSSSLQ